MRKGLFVIAALAVAAGPAAAGPACLGLPLAITGSTYCLGIPEQAGPPKTVTIKVCPQIVARSKEWENKLADAFERLQPDKEMWSMLSEYISLRDQARKCLESGKGVP